MVDGGRILLTLEEGPFLQSAGRTIVPLRDIEDDGVSVELRGGVAVHRTGGVVLELRGDELPGSFGGIVATNPRLRVSLQLVQGVGDGGAVCLSHLVVTAYQCRKRDGFGGRRTSHPSPPDAQPPSSLCHPRSCNPLRRGA